MGHADEHHACRDEDSILSFDDLLQFYHKRLLEAAEQAGTLPWAPKWETFAQQAQVCFLDYLRYLASEVWGSVSPESMERLKGKLNYGLHKRSLPHLLWAIRHGCDCIDSLQRQHVL
mmetsp:Transcript_47027/g.73600  ORF Transcript_47027/g.73600 Transcript_47027/m.73600 type:complete len:117 (+) Transcript_47027:1085-1435(+)